jgi:hypothetical protein
MTPLPPTKPWYWPGAERDRAHVQYLIGQSGFEAEHYRRLNSRTVVKRLAAGGPSARKKVIKQLA